MKPSLLGWTIQTPTRPGDEECTLTLKSDDGRWEAYIKWDGCCEIIRHSVTPIEYDEPEQIHICDMDEYIEMLQAIEKFRVAHFTEQGTIF